MNPEPKAIRHFSQKTIEALVEFRRLVESLTYPHTPLGISVPHPAPNPKA